MSPSLSNQIKKLFTKGPLRHSGQGGAFYFALALSLLMLSPGCGPGSVDGRSPGSSPLSSTTTTTTGTTSSSNQGPSALQIQFTTGSSGSFDSTSAPSTGGTYLTASRVFDLNGNTLTRSSYPTWWFSSAGVFLTSTSTSFPGGGAGATTASSSTKSQTPCAYFDSTNDNNPESGGHYTIDGIMPNPPSLSDGSPTADVDQCAAISASEKSKLGVYFTINRSYFSSTDKLQLIVRVRPLNAPVLAPSPSTCVAGGMFDATACASTVFTVTLRNGIGAAARPFYMLFPSAKSTDLLSEQILLPMNLDTNITTVTIDRLKGGAVFYSATLIRVP